MISGSNTRRRGELTSIASLASRNRWVAMTKRRRQGYFQVVLVGALLNSVLLSVGHAQVTTNITSSGLGTTVSQAGTTWNITGGTRPGNGSNLFHSFGSLNVGAGNTANFCNAASCGVAQPLGGIQNILGRVTGNQVSNIFGTIQTTGFGTANLFLMNPAGWIFGPTASLNVGGSFHVTTADYIRLEDGNRFNAVPSGADALLTVAAPAAFGFLTDPRGSINVQTGERNGPLFTSLLRVPVGQAISFVGGAINMAPSATDPPNPARSPFVLAPGGTVNLVSVASPGEVTALNRPGPLTPINTDGFARLGDVTMSGGSVVDGKEIFIRSGRLLMTDSALFPGFGLGRVPGLPLVFPNGGQVNVRVSDEVRIDGFTQVGGVVLPGIRTFAGVPMPTGTVGGDVPSILIDANSLSMRGAQARIQASRNGSGDPGKIEINANTVTLESGSAIGALNQFAGPGTPVTVNSRTVTLSGDPNSSDVTSIFSNSDFNAQYGAIFGTPARRQFLRDHAFADSGPITINASDKLTVLGSSAITSDSLAFGASSKITLNVGDALFDANFAAKGGALAAQSLLSGTSGSITINASGQVNIQDGFRVTAATFGSGDAGAISITANGGVNLSGTNSRIQSTTFQAPDEQYNTFAQRFAAFFGVPANSFTYAALRTRLGVAPGPGDIMQVLTMLSKMSDSAGNPLVPVTDFTPGSGGTVSITAPVLTASSGSLIETSTAWDGNAGQISANVGSLFLNDGASISSTSGRVNLATGQPAVGLGSAGDISLTAGDAISISGGAVSTGTFGNGDGGSIFLTGGKLVSIQNGGSVSADSGGTLGGQEFSGSGLAGNIKIAAGDQIAMTDGSVSTRAVTSDGGNITLNAPRMIQLTDSQVTTSVESGFGGGGNINIDPQALILNNSQILANAFGGPGGNINITADFFVVNSGGMFPTSLNGIVDASSALSTPGTVNIEATFTNVVGSFFQLPSTPLEATELLRASCAARFSGGKTSSLVLAGRDGLPLQPGGLLPSPLYVANEPDTPTTGTKVTGYDQSLQFSLLGSKDRLLSQYSLLPNVKCAL
jgi:filamentous hemagglutinin family protein